MSYPCPSKQIWNVILRTDAPIAGADKVAASPGPRRGAIQEGGGHYFAQDGSHYESLKTVAPPAAPVAFLLVGVLAAVSIHTPSFGRGGPISQLMSQNWWRVPR
jgi:hypothetical protein